MSPEDDGAAPRRAAERPSAPREPAFNAPWPAPTLAGALLVAHAARLASGIDPDRFALTGPNLAAGRYAGLVTHLFVHASWTHALVNAAFTLVFGVPVARLLGSGPRGAASFFAFFVVCGVTAALAYACLIGLAAAGTGSPPWALVGASAAASGLFGAAARLIEGRGSIGPLGGRTTVSMTAAWIGLNAVLGLSGLTPGAAGVPVAWQAHIFGFLAGLLLIRPAALIAGAPPTGAGPRARPRAITR